MARWRDVGSGDVPVVVEKAGVDLAPINKKVDGAVQTAEVSLRAVSEMAVWVDGLEQSYRGLDDLRDAIKKIGELDERLRGFHKVVAGAASLNSLNQAKSELKGELTTLRGELGSGTKTMLAHIKATRDEYRAELHSFLAMQDELVADIDQLRDAVKALQEKPAPEPFVCPVVPSPAVNRSASAAWILLVVILLLSGAYAYLQYSK